MNIIINFRILNEDICVNYNSSFKIDVELDSIQEIQNQVSKKIG